MARRFTVNPDFMQSVPPATRAKSRASAEHTPANGSATIGARTHSRSLARVIGAATLLSAIGLALYLSPGQNPGYAKPVQSSPDIAPEKPLALSLNNVHNPVHHLTKRIKRNEPSIRYASMGK